MTNLFLGAAVIAAVLTTSAKAEIIDCTEITTIPKIITAQGIYCLKSDKSSPLTSGNMIDIQTNNVTIDLNGFKLGGLGAGPSTSAIGIHAQNRKNITIRNGSVRGFRNGVVLSGSSSSGGLVEGLLLDGNTATGISVQGAGHIVRNNRVVDTAAGVTIEADAIFAFEAQRTVVAGNVIGGVSASALAVGIRVLSSSGIEIRGNSVFDVKDATTTRGIELSGATKVTVIDNRIVNVPVGDVGIIDSAGTTGLVCRDNTVVGFTTALSGCDVSAGNISQ